jgi:catechol 2,3-dioxygenase-like lactoylglutathione lyase family enzyme
VRRPDLDHTSFAVRDAAAWAGRLRRELGAVPIAGETLPEFRYLLLYVGTAECGARIELLEPRGDGFLSRFLARRGEGPHHLTFTVPDLRAAVAQVRDLGGTVTGEDYAHPSWQEAFVMPDSTHGVLIQLATSDRAYPPPTELLASRRRDLDSYPSSRGATDRSWWTALWDVAEGDRAVLGATHLGSTDLGRSRRLFRDVLGGEATEVGGELELRWPSGTVRVQPRETPGVIGMHLRGGPVDDVLIGVGSLQPGQGRWFDVEEQAAAAPEHGR